MNDRTRAALLALALACSVEACAPPPAPAPAPAAPRAAPAADPSPPPDPRAAVARRVARGARAPAAKAFPAALGATPVAAVARPGTVGGSKATIEWSGDHQRFGVARAGEVRVYEAASGREIGARPLRYQHSSSLYDRLSLDRTGARVLVISTFRSTNDAFYELWDVASGERLLTTGSDAESDAAFSPDGGTLAFVRTRGAGGHPGAPRSSAGHPGAPRSSAGHPGAPRSSAGHEVVLWDVRARAEIRALAPEATDGGPPPTYHHGLAFSADGSRVVAAFADKVVRAWDARKGALLATRAFTWTIDGPGVFLTFRGDDGGSGGVPVLHDPESWREIGELSDARCTKANAAWFGPKGAPVVTRPDLDHLCVWDVATRRLSRVIDVPHQERRSGDVLWFTDDGSAILVGFGSSLSLDRADLIELGTGRVTDSLSKVAWLGKARDGAILLLEAGRGELVRVVAPGRVERRTVGAPSTIGAPSHDPRDGLLGELAFTIVPQYLATARAKGGALRFVDDLSGAVVDLRAEDGSWETRASPDGRWLVGVDALGDLRVWDLEARQSTLAVPRGPVSRHLGSLRFSSRGDALGVVSEGGDESRWSAAAAGLAYDGTVGPVPERAEDAPDEAIAPFVLDAEARAVGIREVPRPVLYAPGRRDTATPIRLRPQAVRVQGWSFNDLLLAADGSYLAARWGEAENQFVRMLRLPARAGMPAVEIKGAPENAGVSALAIDPRGRLLAAVVSNKTGSPTEVYAIPSMRKEQTIDLYATALAFAPDGGLLAMSVFKSVRESVFVLWELAAKRERCRAPMEGPLAFSPGGDRIAMVAQGGLVVLDTASCRAVATFAGQARDAHALAFSPDARAIVALESTGTATFYDAADGHELVTLRIGPGFAAAVSSSGRVELFGDQERAKRLVACSARGFTLPFELCEGSALERGLLARLVGARFQERPSHRR